MSRWLRDEHSVTRKGRLGPDPALECALEIRAEALDLLRARGEMQAIDGVPGRVQTCERGSLSFIHRTPFQQLHVAPTEHLYKLALLEQATGRKMSRNLEYGLDIWSEHRKVFNLEWSVGDKEIHLVRFNRGSWQQLLRAEVESLGAPGQMTR